RNAERQENLVGVALLDLNRFKTINDSLGQSLGDLLLKLVAKRLSAVINEGDTVARLAGDEFALVFTDMDRAETISRMATQVLDCFNQAFLVGHHDVFVSASMGIAIYPADGEEVGELMQNAEAGMYRAKRDGGHGYQFYSADMTLKARERLGLENDLRRALDRREFLLHYQPIVDASSGRIN